MTKEKLLEIRNLETAFRIKDDYFNAVDKVSLDLYRNEVLAIVGESGCGKSTLATTVMGLHNENLTKSTGEVIFNGKNLLELTEEEMNKIRTKDIGMIFQDPLSSLNPLHRIGKQIEEALIYHTELSAAEREKRVIELLTQVGIPNPERCAKQYPHELSGGMRQRVMIAMALLCRPKLLIADEPTTALDVTVQAQIMTLLNELKREFNTAIIMITHDLGVVAGICDQVMVMYAGRTMEYGTAEQIFYHPTHPYSIGLMDAIPRLDGNEEHLVTIPGNPPNLLHLPKGCPFSPRCQFATEQCQTAPKLTAFNEGQLRNCWLPVEKFTL